MLYSITFPPKKLSNIIRRRRGFSMFVAWANKGRQVRNGLWFIGFRWYCRGDWCLVPHTAANCWTDNSHIYCPTKRQQVTQYYRKCIKRHDARFETHQSFIGKILDRLIIALVFVTIVKADDFDTKTKPLLMSWSNALASRCTIYQLEFIASKQRQWNSLLPARSIYSRWIRPFFVSRPLRQRF